jgi:hypothetical protein
MLQRNSIIALGKGLKGQQKLAELRLDHNMLEPPLAGVH